MTYLGTTDEGRTVESPSLQGAVFALAEALGCRSTDLITVQRTIHANRIAATWLVYVGQERADADEASGERGRWSAIVIELELR